MQKLFRFNFKLDAHDRDCLLWLSARLRRSQSDTIRWLLQQAAAGGMAAGTEAPSVSLPFEPLRIIGDWEEWGDSSPRDEEAQ